MAGRSGRAHPCEGGVGNLLRTELYECLAVGPAVGPQHHKDASQPPRNVIALQRTPTNQSHILTRLPLFPPPPLASPSHAPSPHGSPSHLPLPEALLPNHPLASPLHCFPPICCASPVLSLLPPTPHPINTLPHPTSPRRVLPLNPTPHPTWKNWKSSSGVVLKGSPRSRHMPDVSGGLSHCGAAGCIPPTLA